MQFLLLFGDINRNEWESLGEEERDREIGRAKIFCVSATSWNEQADLNKYDQSNKID